MDNLTATSYLCTAICSSFYPDDRAVEIAIFNANMLATDEAIPRDPNIFKIAVSLVRGYVESSRSEGGVSVGVSRNAVEDAIKAWAKDYGVDEEEIALKPKTIENGSLMW